MLKSVSRVCVVALLVVLASVPAWAQRTTGTINGNVADEQGAVLPVVTVTLTGPAMQGTPTDVTTQSGAYRFPNLSPGVYTLTFSLAGFANLERTQIQVGVGATVEIDAQLK